MNAHQKATVNHLPLHPTMRHPLTGLPLRAVGVLPSGKVVWPIMGGAPDDPPPDTEDWSKVFEGKTPAQVLAALTASEQKAQAADKWANVFPDLAPEKVKEAVDNSRKWESRATENRAKALQFDGLVSTLGLAPKEGEGEPTDDKDKPDVTAAVEKTKAENAALARENAVLRHAPEGVSGQALVDSRTFMETIGTLDPAAEDFTTKLGEAIKTQVENDKTGRFQTAPTGRPRTDPRQGLTSEGKTGTTESGRTAYQERKKKRTFVGSSN